MDGEIAPTVGKIGAMKSRGNVNFFVVAVILVISFVSAVHSMNLNTTVTSSTLDENRLVRMRELTQKLRCLVCQNQSLAESDADLAVDLRRQIENKVNGGESDEQIIRYLVDRYGDFILYDPPLKPSTIVLWFGPLLLAIVSLGILLRLAFLRRAATPEVSSELERRLLGELRERVTSSAENASSSERRN